MKKIGFGPANILLPAQADLSKWSVVACDQYTSEPAYWAEVENTVGEAPSMLRLTLPEIYLEQDGVDERISQITRSMQSYLDTDVFAEYPSAYLYLERKLADGTVRKGLIGMVDLEQYDYNRGSTSLIRATEGTVLERIPPRVRVRENAPLESPHVMLLIDDPEKNVIEPLAKETERLIKLYDFELMQNGGHSTGYLIGAEQAARVEEALLKLYQASEEKYQNPLLFAVGDGNHSLATAKACYEQFKQTHDPSEWSDAPARYALVEVVNLHDDSLQFEPIHRVIFGVDPNHFLRSLTEHFEVSATPEEGIGQTFKYVTGDNMGQVSILNPDANLCVGTLQGFIDTYLKNYGGKVDYIHGDEVVISLSAQPDSIGLILPKMEKSDLFETIQKDGVLPRKTFSMGHANDKRFYLECRKIK
ncbi:MAG: DUF1015 domain-containing protein [Oscillospiraceae bacterium]|nr:DUF1015 domain-containing protein [Oscillospiraceae bacterium]